MPTPTFNILVDVKIFCSVCNEIRDFLLLINTLVCSIRADLDVDICITDTLLVDPFNLEGFHSTSNPRARALCTETFSILGISGKWFRCTFFWLFAVEYAAVLRGVEGVCSGSTLSIELLCSSITSANHDLMSASFAASVTLILSPPGYERDTEMKIERKAVETVWVRDGRWESERKRIEKR